ncbi:MAG: hypothetical protein KC496_12605, partial [Anaerolineae bacterium]|nr:hypothetical protein [Anaerolineae bacterium]
DFQVKQMHHLRLVVREGFFNDTIELYLDGMLVTSAKAGFTAWRGSTSFDIDGRMFELRWVWNMLSGNPASIMVTYGERVFAQYGSDAALQD